MATLLERATKIREWNAAQCKIPGSGCHDKDDGRGEAKRLSPQNRGLPAIRDHAVAFHGRYEHTFHGECAQRASAALAKYASDGTDCLADPTCTNDKRMAIIVAKEYAAKPTADILVVRNAQWNAVLFALSESGIGVTVAGEKESGEVAEGECPR